MKGSSLTELDEIRIDPARHHLKQEYLGLQRAVSVGRAGMTKGKFGFRGGGKHEPGPAAGYVQIYVKSSCSVGPVVRPNWRLLPAAPL